MRDRMKLRGIGVELWIWEVEGSIDAGDVGLRLAGLEKLLNGKTRLVAFTGTSNILGEVTPIKAVVDLVKAKSPRAYTSVDCVAFAPHRRMEVEKWGVDFANFSLYKVSFHARSIRVTADGHIIGIRTSRLCPVCGANRPRDSLLPRSFFPRSFSYRPLQAFTGRLLIRARRFRIARIRLLSHALRPPFDRFNGPSSQSSFRPDRRARGEAFQDPHRLSSLCTRSRSKDRRSSRRWARKSSSYRQFRRSWRSPNVVQEYRRCVRQD